MSGLYGGIEAGGTKFICAVGAAPDKITAQAQIPTTSPAETLAAVVSFFASQPQVQAIGIASFGPVDINKQSPTYGYITTTPKPNWANTDLLGTISRALHVPVTIDTDVNCAALAEQQYGAAKGLDNVAYMTVGTGIGVGCIVNGQILQGISHTEIGHILIPQMPEDSNFAGSCPYHKGCLEGLASGAALSKRWGVAAEELTDNQAWSLEAQYLATGLYNVITTVMPQRIVVGGGVMNHQGLLEAVRQQVPVIANGYIEATEITQGIDNYIVAPKLGSLSGVTGAICIAKKDYDKRD